MRAVGGVAGALERIDKRLWSPPHEQERADIEAQGPCALLQPHGTQRL